VLVLVLRVRHVYRSLNVYKAAYLPSSPQSIWLLFLSTSLPKFLSLPVMQPVITRNNVLSLVIFNWLLGTTKSRVSYLVSIIINFTESGFRLCRLLGDVVISQGGVVPHIAPVSYIGVSPFIDINLVRFF
jgi:hypothetical protein